METPVHRRLTAILAADIAAFSRLVGLDEEGVIAAHRAHRVELIDPLVEKHGGRVANTAGDSLLIEFPSAVEAVRFARSMQSGMEDRNRDVAEDRRITYRIGINIGDVIAQDDDLLGDGVNIAARLESLAPAGGIIVSRTVRDQVRDRLELNLADLGEVRVKNMSRPVRAFQILGEGDTAIRVPAPAKGRMAVLAVAVIALALLAGGAMWWKSIYPGSGSAVQDASSRFSDKPSIAVLPFDNLSGDDSQVYFSDGMTEDIITDLAKVSGLFVIARNSSFAYRGGDVDIKKAGRELGARYILEGSVQRSGDRVRVNAQLVDVQSGGHLWADRIDSKASNIFQLQDQITKRIVDALKIKLTAIEQERRAIEIKVNPQAYYLYLQGLKLSATFREDDLLEMLQLYDRAAKLDPDFAEAHARLAHVAYEIARLEKPWIMPLPKALELMQTHLDRALELQPDNVTALATSAHRALEAGHAKEASETIERATVFAPSNINVLTRKAYILSRSGRYADAASTARLVQRLEQNATAAQLMVLSNVYFHASQYDRSVELGERAKAMGIRPLWALETVVADYAQLNMQEKLHRAMAEFRKAWPTVNLQLYRSKFSYFSPQATLDHWIESLELAGVPEWPTGILPTAENMLTETEARSLSEPEVQRIGTTLEGRRFRSATGPDGKIRTSLQIAGRQQFELTEVFTRRMLSEDGKHVLRSCSKNPNWNMGRERCGLLLRNPGGTKKNRDEFIYVSDRSLSKFAVFPIAEKIDWKSP